MNAINLASPTFVVTNILRKTRAETFADWQVGDDVRFHTNMRAMAGASGGGVYASMFVAENVTRGTRVSKSQSNMVGVLRNFELQPKEGVDIG